MFFSHTIVGCLGIGHVTKRWAVAFVASAITDLPTHPPALRFSFVGCLNVMCNFVILLIVSRLSRGILLCVHF